MLFAYLRPDWKKYTASSVHRAHRADCAKIWHKRWVHKGTCAEFGHTEQFAPKFGASIGRTKAFAPNFGISVQALDAYSKKKTSLTPGIGRTAVTNERIRF